MYHDQAYMASRLAYYYAAVYTHCNVIAAS